MKMLKLEIVLFLLVALMVTGCVNKKKGDKKSATAKKEIAIGYVDGWAEGVAMTYVTQEVFREKGYTVKLQKAAVDLIFASLSNGDTDAFMDTWLPVTHGSKVKKFTDKIESLGVNYDNAKIGLVVPQYVTINSIEELNANAKKFDNRIVGIEKGAGITAKTDVAVKEYRLKLEHMNSSSVAMLSELKKAIDKKEWIVVAGWAPHWKFGRYDLKFLDDPKGVYGSAERIETYARKGFKEEDAFAAKYFANFHLDDKQMADLLLKMEDSDSKEAAAKQWVSENKTLVDSWID